MPRTPDETARQISLICWAIRDTLYAARSHASRPQTEFSGRPEFKLLWDAEKAISDVIDSDAMRALGDAGVPPSMLGGDDGR